MSGRPRTVFHPDSINDMWRLWKAGGTLTELGELLGVNRNLTKSMVVARGGIAPPPRCRNSRHVTARLRRRSAALAPLSGGRSTAMAAGDAIARPSPKRGPSRTPADPRAASSPNTGRSQISLPPN